MKKLKCTVVLAILFCGGLIVNAQEKTKRLEFKKGEVLDILLFTGKPDFSKLFPRYKETAFTFALKTGYQPQPILSIVETTQGGIQPGSFVFGKWTDLASRKKFLNEITTVVPDFHEQRRAMWSSFYLAYYEIKEDTFFDLNPEKVLVATAYWKEDTGTFMDFKKKWLKKAKSKGGKVLLELNDSMSSVGYMYKPDYMVLTEWNDRASFDAFAKESMKMGDKGIRNVNQFIIK
ncbi:hypothetical protein [Maribacter sp. 2210JD10-5]|uniref:hypothetical protein n=1 Tax=Maribacter sp. 2210JD10-5 TaxID=3386272 RepID=UPI0039BC6F4C